jgi:hypothetical protein
MGGTAGETVVEYSAVELAELKLRRQYCTRDASPVIYQRRARETGSAVRLLVVTTGSRAGAPLEVAEGAAVSFTVSDLITPPSERGAVGGIQTRTYAPIWSSDASGAARIRQYRTEGRIVVANDTAGMAGVDGVGRLVDGPLVLTAPPIQAGRCGGALTLKPELSLPGVLTSARARFRTGGQVLAGSYVKVTLPAEWAVTEPAPFKVPFTILSSPRGLPATGAGLPAVTGEARYQRETSELAIRVIEGFVPEGAGGWLSTASLAV